MGSVACCEGAPIDRRLARPYTSLLVRGRLAAAKRARVTMALDKQSMVDPDRLSAAYETARCDLLAESASNGHWIGQLSSSVCATAAAISALAIVERHSPTAGGRFADEAREGRLSQLIMASVHWLADCQNADGGWGDTDKSHSNIAATMLVRAAFALTAVPATHPGMLERADAYIKVHGGVRGVLDHFGRDKVLAVPVLVNAALAGIVRWRKVPSPRFELACVPRRVWSLLGLGDLRPALPAIIALGLARYFHRRPRNPIMHLVRSRVIGRSLETLERVQPASGGFLEMVPLTSYVVMSLASIGRAGHPVVKKGVEFLLGSVRSDGTWPITGNLATWSTALAVTSLATAGEDVRELGGCDWLLACQHGENHPKPGGWAWTDAAGAPADAGDTAAALLALSPWAKSSAAPDATRIEEAASRGVKWLLEMQNDDGGWPTFCRGAGKLPYDRSACDLTAYALRALTAWRTGLVKISDHSLELRRQLDVSIGAAIERGLRYLSVQQDPAGFWLPRRIGNQNRADEANPIYGTCQVLAVYRDLGRLDDACVPRALAWLMATKHADGSWGGAMGAPIHQAACRASVEETALAVDALGTCGRTSAEQVAAQQGLEWLISAVESNKHQHGAPIGVTPGPLWYYEKVFPLAWCVAALGRHVRRPAGRTETPAAVHSSKP
jgi:squalene-hopene/tetraprenyl-beta-curcumene cyclase